MSNSGESSDDEFIPHHEERFPMSETALFPQNPGSFSFSPPRLPNTVSGLITGRRIYLWLILLIAIPLIGAIFPKIALVPISIVCSVFTLVFFTARYKRRHGLFLLDFSIFRPPQSICFTRDSFVEALKSHQCYTDDSLEFIRRILYSSGIGDESALPLSIANGDISLETRTAETRLVIFDICDQLLRNNPLHIDYIIVACSLFNPTPSFAAEIIARYDLHRAEPFSLGGHGCAGGLRGVRLAQTLLSQRPSRALVIATENITTSFYRGNDRSMLIPNTLFRLGGAAQILSSVPDDSVNALLRLNLTHQNILTQRGFLNGIRLREDYEGNFGLHLSRNLLYYSVLTVRNHLRKVAPLVLPVSQQLTLLFRWAWARMRHCVPEPDVVHEWPDFTIFDHLCIHPGGRGVLDLLVQKLSLNAEQAEASYATLWRYGNVSSAAVWYELAFLLSRGRIQNGNKILQIAYGAGFECVSAAWTALPRAVSYEIEFE